MVVEMHAWLDRCDMHESATYIRGGRAHSKLRVCKLGVEVFGRWERMHVEHGARWSSRGGCKKHAECRQAVQCGLFLQWLAASPNSSITA
jgi:hypothetical protein